MAKKEENYADDKKFMLCMSKLAALASDSNDKEHFVDEVDNHLRLLEFQNRLPDDILNVFGMEKESMRVLSPSEMIDMYTYPDVEFDPENFTNALGLADFMINEDLKEEKR